MHGFYRQLEFYYVVADERDLIALRTEHRGERVELYRTIAIRLPDFTTVSLYFGLRLTRFFVGLRHDSVFLFARISKSRTNF